MKQAIVFVLWTLVMRPTFALAEQNDTRSFFLGFTSWPYDMTVEAVNWVTTKVNANGDLISHHIEEGVPWAEAASDQPFPTEYLNSLNDRIEKFKGKKSFLSVSPINGARNGLADYRDKGINSPLPAAWKGRRLNSTEVKSAYLNYVRRMVDLFHPDYLAIGVEVNLLIRNKAEVWSEYLELHKFVFESLKKSHPRLPILASIDVNAVLPGYSTVDNLAAQEKGLRELLPYVDILGVSLHPVMGSYRADKIPPDMFEKVFALTKKPIAITEASYSAQPWTLTVNGTKFSFLGSIEKQSTFTSLLLNAANSHNCPFVVMFTIRDYDELWNKLGKSDAALPWRDSGLYDEAGAERKAMGVWRSFYSKKPKLK